MDLDTLDRPAAHDGGGALDAGPQPRLIKRYPNRKFYDTSQSRYVNLTEIGELVAAGVEVKIVDSDTLQDRTFVTLGHVLVDAGGRGAKDDAARALARLIREDGATPVARGATERRLQGVLSRAAREGHSVARMLASADAALAALERRMDGEQRDARAILAAFQRLKSDLARFAVRVDELHERLRETDRLASARRS